MRTRLFTVSMPTRLDRPPFAGQPITAGAAPDFAFTEQQSDMRISSRRPKSSQLPRSLLLAGLLGLRGIARIRRGFNKRICVGFCIVESHQNLFLFESHFYF